MLHVACSFIIMSAFLTQEFPSKELELLPVLLETAAASVGASSGGEVAGVEAETFVEQLNVLGPVTVSKRTVMRSLGTTRRIVDVSGRGSCAGGRCRLPQGIDFHVRLVDLTRTERGIDAYLQVRVQHDLETGDYEISGHGTVYSFELNDGTWNLVGQETRLRS
jgi:hypothetical protein